MAAQVVDHLPVNTDFPKLSTKLTMTIPPLSFSDDMLFVPYLQSKTFRGHFFIKPKDNSLAFFTAHIKGSIF